MKTCPECGQSPCLERQERTGRRVCQFDMVRPFYNDAGDAS